MPVVEIYTVGDIPWLGGVAPAGAVLNRVLLAEGAVAVTLAGTASRPDTGTSVWTPPPAPVVPSSITNAQARAVMIGIPSPSGTAGRTLFDDVDEAIKARGGVAVQFWEYGNTFDRTGALVGSMAAQFGFSPAQLDQIFVTGSGLTI